MKAFILAAAALLAGGVSAKALPAAGTADARRPYEMVWANRFAVKYHLNLPTVEELQMELMRERAAIEEAMAVRALPPPEPKKKSAPRKTSKGGR